MLAWFVWKSSSDDSCSCRPERLHCRDGRVFLRLDWTAERLAPFDTQAWTHAAVDDSASPAAMQPTLDIIKARAHGCPHLPCILVLRVSCPYGPARCIHQCTSALSQLPARRPCPCPSAACACRPTTIGRPKRRAPSSCRTPCWRSSSLRRAARSRASCTRSSEQHASQARVAAYGQRAYTSLGAGRLSDLWFRASPPLCLRPCSSSLPVWLPWPALHAAAAQLILWRVWWWTLCRIATGRKGRRAKRYSR